MKPIRINIVQSSRKKNNIKNILIRVLNDKESKM